MNKEHTLTEQTSGTDTLAQRWLALKKEDASIRIRNAAQKLGCCELELLALHTGEHVVRLQGDFKKLLTQIESLGEVMALTRNDAMVHEKTGQYKGLTLHGHMGLALGEIDLRIFFNQFVYGYAVCEESLAGMRRSLQFFNADGVAVHKIYLREHSDLQAYQQLVDSYRADDQSAPHISTATESADDNKLMALPQDADIETLQKGWRELKDVHHFQALLKKHQIERIPAYQAVDDDLARPLHSSAFEAALTLAAELQLSIMIFVGSPGVVQIFTGQLDNLKRTGPWFNVLDPGFNLHADTTQIAHLWVVRKPTVDGIVTSLEMFDDKGQQLALLFGERKNGDSEQAAWRELVHTLEMGFGINEKVAV